MINIESLSPGLNYDLYRELLEKALLEDLGRGGDLTTRCLFPTDRQAQAVIRARTPGVVAGLGPALSVFEHLDPQMDFEVPTKDCNLVEAGGLVVRLKGSLQAILTAERTALNILGHLGGIATKTQRFVTLVQGTKARIADTRKTLPGLRVLQKYAVRCGGGFNHRMGLDDAIMIKDNHIAAAGSLTKAVLTAKAAIGHTIKIEVEVDNLDQLRELLSVGADIVLLDNLRGEDLKIAVEMCKGKILTEASGGITEDTISEVARSGVDVISIGALTHSVLNWDVGLDWEV